MDKSKEICFLERINRKERDAYHELFGQFYQSLVLYAMRFLGSQEEAEDIVQDLFVSVWEKKEGFLSYTSLHTYLYNSVRNICLNAIKHARVRQRFADFTLRSGSEEEFPDNGSAEEELYRRLFLAVDRLSPRCKEVFLLHLDGKTNEEIARELAITVATVKTQKKHALHALREDLGQSSCLAAFLIHLFSGVA